MNCAQHEADLQAALARVRELERELASVLNGKDALGKKLCDAARLPPMPLSSAVDQVIADATRLAQTNTRLRGLVETETEFLDKRAAEADAMADKRRRQHKPEDQFFAAGRATAYRGCADGLRALLAASEKRPDRQQTGAAGTKPEGLAAVQPDPEGQPPPRLAAVRAGREAHQ